MKNVKFPKNIQKEYEESIDRIYRTGDYGMCGSESSAQKCIYEYYEKKAINRHKTMTKLLFCAFIILVILCLSCILK